MRFDTDATALTLAAQRGWLEVCAVLLDNGAEIEVRDMTGRTPLRLEGHDTADVCRWYWPGCRCTEAH
eukprot:g19435.t1